MKRLITLFALLPLLAFGQSLSGTNVWTGSNYFSGPMVIGGAYASNVFEVLTGEGDLAFHVDTNGTAYGIAAYTLVSAETNGISWWTNSSGHLIASNTSPTWTLVGSQTNGIVFYAENNQLIASNSGPAYALDLESSVGIAGSLSGSSLILSNTFRFPDGSRLWVSNSTHLYWSTSTKTNLVSF